MKGKPGLVNVFLHAPKKFRVNRVMEIYNVAASHQAEAMISDSDTSRKNFIEKMTRENWSNALNFHLCIDTEAAGFSNVVEAIIGIVNNMQRTTPQKTFTVRERLSQFVDRSAAITIAASEGVSPTIPAGCLSTL